MKYLDYREALGVAFNDEEKRQIFISRMQVYFWNCRGFEFSDLQETSFCYEIGVPCKLEMGNPIDLDIMGTDPVGMQRVWLYLNEKADCFEDFLASIVVLGNTYNGDDIVRRDIINNVRKALSDTNIPYEVYEDQDGLFFFPQGAKELDNALVSEPLEWLSDFRKAHKTFVIALKQYSDGIYIRDVADNLRKALEEFLQEFLGNNKNLETNKNEICRYLGSQNVDAKISGLFQQLINAYKDVNDRIAKHNDAVDAKLLEFLLYQTGLLIRMVLVVKQSET